jgi:sulfonate transport system substrate-binding protein
VTISRRLARPLALAATLAMVMSGCGDGDASGAGADTLTLDWATYNPLSLIIRDQGWLEDALADDGVEVEWIQSAGSNRANEGLRAGALDVGSTAGSAALLARSNGSPIKVISLYTQPEWAAIVVRADSPIDDVADLAGASIAATLGTDPYFFFLQALEEAGIELADVEVQNLQHADGRTALDQGNVDAWAGLDPIMAASEAESGTELIYRNIDFNTWGFLNATESFLEESPELAQLVVNAYERARVWAQDNPDETAELLAEEAGIDLEVARVTLLERTNIDIDPVPGETQRAVLEIVGPIFVESGDVDDQASIDDALANLFEPSFAESADASEAGSS